ncbi:MAG TPA: SRPBCC family protein [Anaerolineae bacterium]|nr:SRPBCC family protein [Anaerolineae bacterium]
MRISFDHTIATTLSREQLWALVEQSFRNSDASPIWPHALESIRSAQVETGALVRATYKGPADMQSHVTYRFVQVEPGRQLSYVAEPSHPLRGGGTVEILPAPAGCVLHWHGAYDVPWRPAALAAALFTRAYFAGRFFGTLEEKLREWE